MKKLIALLLVAAMLMAFAGCKTDKPVATTVAGGTNPNATPAPTGTGEKVTYFANVATKGGMAMPGLDVYIYADEALTDMKAYGQTDEMGDVTFQLEGGLNYYIQVSGAPKGYLVNKSYRFNGTSAAIVLDSQLVADTSLAGAKLGVGDVMYDFAVSTPDGTMVKLSDMLKEKDMVLLNFWYTTCQYCVAEFPYMEEAYQQYSDKVGIIALDPMDSDSEVAAFRQQMGLTFPMASCAATWAAAFGVEYYPTSIIIDRYGVICMIEAGGITSLRPFVSLFETFTGDNYQQKLYTSLDEIVTRVAPTFQMDTTENIAAVLNSGDFTVTYRGEAEDEYSWPFIAAEKLGEQCMKASNQQMDDSYAILYMDVELKAGQAVGFDYLVSSEAGNDVMHVIVNDEPVYTISGVNDPEQWETCYPWVAEADGVYEVALCYIKDGSTSSGDDTVYIKDLRVVAPSEISTETYIPRYAATSADGFDYSYVTIVFNDKDGFYHVGDKNGPLLLADLMNTTQFNEEQTVWSMVDAGLITMDGHNYYEELVEYCSLAARSQLNGMVPVTEELASYLKIVAKIAGFDGSENEWLKICKYYEAYGGKGKQLENPILGLAEFCPLTAKLGKNVATNFFFYDRALLPRGKVAEFVPTRSGAYRITSHGEAVSGIEGWIFYENMADKENPDHVFEGGERMYTDMGNVSMVVYMEAGKSYFIDICFWDMYETGTIPYDIEYLGASYDLFTACAPGYFTYDAGATGEEMYYLIAKGIDVALGADGYYYEVRGTDAKGNPILGSAIYCDFTGINIFSGPIASVPAYNEDGTPVKDAEGKPVMIEGMIDLGNFDFSKNENDMYILSFMDKFDGDAEATDKHLRELWGAEYDAYAEIYQVEDVYEGKYHGNGEDMTEKIRPYLNKVITGGPAERNGCVKVDAELAQILQALMDKYTFAGVDNSWLKLCYYYQHLGK